MPEEEDPVMLGEVLIRCNNVLYLRAAPKKEDVQMQE
jgi:hypothetical protein